MKNMAEEYDYEKICTILQKQFELDKTPVAVKLYEYSTDIGDDLEKYDGKERHCGMIFEAATNKTQFYATVDEYSCPNGAAALGLMDLELNNVPKVDPVIEAVAYAPLDKTTFKPDVIVLYVTPMQIMKISQILRRSAGKRFGGDFSGIQSLCADVVSKPYLTNESNLSVGCNGSRGFTDIKPEELVVGLTLSDAQSITDYV